MARGARYIALQRTHQGPCQFKARALRNTAFRQCKVLLSRFAVLSQCGFEAQFNVQGLPKAIGVVVNPGSQGLGVVRRLAAIAAVHGAL